jgi:hypothetical protein
MGNFITQERLFMQIRRGYSYHIRDEFFDLVQDKYLMSNKEQENYRPHYYAIQDKKNQELYWMIPISSQAEKYKEIIEKKKKRYGKCNTIIIGLFAGKENAFLIQNAFPVIEKYFDHVHTIQEQLVTIHKKLDKLLVENLNEVLAMYNRGIKLTFTDIKVIRTIMECILKYCKEWCLWDFSFTVITMMETMILTDYVGI